MSKKLDIGIVGAGIQGISNALFLQKKGFNVTIFDRDEPGSPAASYGNAGHFSPYASLSLNRTDVLADVPSMLLRLYRTFGTEMELCTKRCCHGFLNLY